MSRCNLFQPVLNSTGVARLWLGLFLVVGLAGHAVAEVRSSIRLTPHSQNHNPSVQSTQEGFLPIADEFEINETVGAEGFSRQRGTTASAGVALVNVSGREGLFIDTQPFRLTARAEAGRNPSSGGIGANAASTLESAGAWRFDSLDGSLTGTQGTYVATFRVALTGAIETVELIPNQGDGQVGVGTDIQGRTNFVTNTNGGGISGSYFLEAAPVDFTFGTGHNYQYSVSAFASVGDVGPNDSALKSADTHAVGELWSVEVFDGAGVELDRFDDYEWFGILGPDERPPDPSAASFLSGGVSRGMVDAFEFPFATASLTRATELAGDYNASGQVEQGDLDLVLQNWGVDTDTAGIPSGWINDLPGGQIEQTELDGVLQNWGSTSAPDFGSNNVPEPAGIAWLAACVALMRRRTA